MSRKNQTSGRLFVVCAIAVCCIAANREARATNEVAVITPTTCLLYSDESGGALFYAEVWYQSAIAQGQAVTYTGIAEDFTIRLASRTWDRVVVMFRYTADEPCFATALRQFATANPEVPVQMMIWHDHGASIPANTAMMGSTAIVLWKNTLTTSVYGLIHGPSEAREATTNSGLNFPGFHSVNVKYSQSAWTIEPSSVTHVAIPTTQPKPVCEVECFDVFMEDVGNCHFERDERYDVCDTLHANDPAELIACYARADQKHINCMNEALDDYNDCVAVCRIPPLE